MKQKARILFLTLVLIAGLSTARPVNAQTCVTEYGGTSTCPTTALTINKQIFNPITRVFSENLGVNQAFAPTEEVLFKLTVINSSNQNVSTVTVKDIFPKFMTFSAGPGTFDKNTNTLTFTMDNIPAGQSKTQEILGQVAPLAQLSGTPKTFCVTNAANATANGQTDDDTAQLCIATEKIVVSTLPVAGFNDLLLLLPFAGVGLTGLALFKKRG